MTEVICETPELIALVKVKDLKEGQFFSFLTNPDDLNVIIIRGFSLYNFSSKRIVNINNTLQEMNARVYDKVTIKGEL